MARLIPDRSIVMTEPCKTETRSSVDARGVEIARPGSLWVLVRQVQDSELWPDRGQTLLPWTWFYWTLQSLREIMTRGDGTWDIVTAKFFSTVFTVCKFIKSTFQLGPRCDATMDFSFLISTTLLLQLCGLQPHEGDQLGLQLQEGACYDYNLQKVELLFLLRGEAPVPILVLNPTLLCVHSIQL